MNHARIGWNVGLLMLGAAVVAGSATAGNGWGNDREPDWNDAQCDDDEGTGNDWKCEGGSKK